MRKKERKTAFANARDKADFKRSPLRFFDTLEFIRQKRPYLVERQKIISDTISMLSYLQASDGGDDREEGSKGRESESRWKPIPFLVLL